MVKCEIKENEKVEISIVGDNSMVIRETLHIASAIGFTLVNIAGNMVEVTEFADGFAKDLKEGILALFDEKNKHAANEISNAIKIKEKKWQ